MLMMRNIFSLLADDTATFERCTAEVTPIAEEHKLTVWLGFSLMMSEIVAARNDDKTSIQRYMMADAAMVATKVKMFVPQSRIAMAWCALALGLRDEAAELAGMEQDMISQTGEAYALSDLYRLQASLSKAVGDNDVAEKHLGSALDVARQQRAKLWELRAAIDLAQLWQDQGRLEEALSVLDPVYKSIAAGDCPDDQAIAQVLLNDLVR